MKTYIIVLLVSIISINSNAQYCDCPKQFDFLKNKITINYSGYKDKVTPKNQKEYEDFTTRYTNLTENTTMDSTCFRLLDEWTEWFKDGHIQMANNSNLPPEEVRSNFADWEK